MVGIGLRTAEKPAVQTRNTSHAVASAKQELQNEAKGEAARKGHGISEGRGVLHTSNDDFIDLSISDSKETKELSISGQSATQPRYHIYKLRQLCTPRDARSKISCY